MIRKTKNKNAAAELRARVESWTRVRRRHARTLECA